MPFDSLRQASAWFNTEERDPPWIPIVAVLHFGPGYCSWTHRQHTLIIGFTLDRTGQGLYAFRCFFLLQQFLVQLS